VEEAVEHIALDLPAAHSSVPEERLVMGWTSILDRCLRSRRQYFGHEVDIAEAELYVE
jgi:hypothetical protein